MKPTDFAGHLTKYLTVYLPAHQGAKSNTIHSYRDSFSLLIEYCRDRERIPPEKLSVSRVDKRLILRFIDWLEKERGCSISTRNHRLASIRSFFAYLAVEAPEYLEQCQRIFSIPMKKAKKPPLKYLTLEHEKMKLEALTKAYNNPTDSELPSWKKDRDLLDWLKSL